MAAGTDGIARPDNLPLKLKVALLMFLCGILLCYNGVEETYSGLLATYCINHFKWSKATSSFSTSLQWAAFSLGRFSGIFLVKLFKSAQLLCVYLISLIVSFIGLTVASHTFITELAWVFIQLAGLTMSICFASIFSWTEESIIKVTGKVSAVLLIASSVGIMLNPSFLGYLMDTFANVWFVHLLLGESCMCFILFITIYVIV
jgi:FHS family Na+ dependent glucose MFS transporter 1